MCREEIVEEWSRRGPLNVLQRNILSTLIMEETLAKKDMENNTRLKVLLLIIPPPMLATNYKSPELPHVTT